MWLPVNFILKRSVSFQSQLFLFKQKKNEHRISQTTNVHVTSFILKINSKIYNHSNEKCNMVYVPRFPFDMHFRKHAVIAYAGYGVVTAASLGK